MWKCIHLSLFKSTVMLGGISLDFPIVLVYGGYSVMKNQREAKK